MGALLKDPNFPIEYEPALRSYFIVGKSQTYRKELEETVRYDLTHCPKCGTKLPKNLTDEWLVIVKKEFGIKNITDKKIAQLPQKYTTDAWWKNKEKNS